MLHINLTKKPDHQKLTHLLPIRLLVLVLLFEEEQRKKSKLLTRGSLKFEKIERIQIPLQTCKQH